MQGLFLFTFAIMAGWKFYLNGTEVEEPIGWDAIEFTAIRMESHGIDQPFSTELRFYNKGAKLIKELYDTYFINAEITIKITSNVGYSGSVYEFEGMLNLSIYQEYNVCDTDSWEVTVGIIDDNFRENFKSRQDVDIDITTPFDLDGNPIAPISPDFIRMHKQDTYITAQGGNLAFTILSLEYDTNDIAPPWDWVYPKYAQIIPCYWRNSDFKNNFGSTLNTQGKDWSDDNVIFKNNSTQTRTINIQARVSGEQQFSTVTLSSESVNADFFVILQSPAGAQTFYTIGSSEVITQSTIISLFDLSNQFSIPVPPDWKLILTAWWGVGGTMKREDPIGGVFFGGPYFLQLYVENVCVTLSEINSGEFASFSEVLKIENILNRTIYKLTGSNNKLLSNAFSQAADGCYWNNAITNGVRIRNAPTIDDVFLGCPNDENASNQFAIELSWKSLFDNLDRIFCLGWAFEWTGTEWKIRVEPRDYFYQNSISQSFENVGEVTQMAKPDLLANNILVGYNDNWRNIAQSGTFAIHTSRSYFVGNKALNENNTQKLDLRSEIIAEGYAIEFSRRLQFFTDDSSSSDRPNDYNLFIIWLNRFNLNIENIEDSEYAIPDESGAVVLPAGTVSMSSNRITASNSPINALYNIYHTPARIACRWWKVLGMHTYGVINPKLRFQVGQYQTSYSSTINGNEENEDCIEIFNGEIAEDSDIYADILNPAYKEYLFKPIAIEFSYPQSLCDFLTLSQDEQYRKVRLTSGSLDVQGFITEAMNQPEDASGGTTKFTLLMSAQTSGVGGAFTDGYSTGFDNGE